MAKVDLVLLHAPSVYDFRESSIMFGPVSDLVPSTPIFEMYPIGFSTMAEYLERHGFQVRIVNLAVQMLRNPRFNLDKAIASLHPAVFGIDLHWLPHAQGSIEIARLVKKHHPSTPVVFGGLSSSYFHRELIEYPCVDYVLRGDSCEEPLLRLMRAIAGRVDFDEVPNLTWKMNDGAIRVNDLTHVPEDINGLSLNYSYNMRSVIRYRDMSGAIPFKDWLEYPITAALTCRGCTHSCVTCGGSAFALNNFAGRKRAAFRDPDILAQDIRQVSKYIPGPIFVLGDISQPGPDYADRLLSQLKTMRLRNQVAFEFFKPPAEQFFERLEDSLDHYSIEISMESHDEEIRRTFGKNYTNEALEASIGYALKHSCERVDVYFMTGIPKQTADSVRETGAYCDNLYQKMGGDRRMLVFTSPMAPFLDPGSIVWENPEKYGYRLRCRTLEEHRQALLQPSWKYIMNYESEYMSPDEHVEATYQAGIDLNRVKARYGVLDQETAGTTEARIQQARKVMSEIDEIMTDDASKRGVHLANLKHRVDTVNESTVCEKKELVWPTKLLSPQTLACAGLWFQHQLARLIPPKERYDRGEN
ncbi:MAG: TIGR04190 family B12-binding domain/radical SAM domain protein [Actinobacteria bacterium]|nr:MAG: TIGR04190 family B12-binding domain/radical SAM domain protein [Actinomycetota bacterium]